MEIIARSSSDNENTIALEFDRKIFDIETLKRAALKFTGSASFSFSFHDESIVVAVNFLTSGNSADAQKFVNEFNIEVLDQDLRRKVAAETEEVRNLILANVFSKITTRPA
jgi:His-Xaa-Ser system protein HxsD